MTNFLHGELTFYLRGAGFRLHNALRGGHEEKVYEDGLAWIFDREKITYWRQKQYVINYRGKQVGEYYPDFVFSNGKVVMDLKASPEINNLHKAQMISYLAVTGAELGFIMNFGTVSMQTERLPNFLNLRKPFAWKPTISTSNLFPEITNQVLHTLHIVHHELGPGFLHQVYRRASRAELSNQGVNFIYLKELPIRFENLNLGTIPTRLFWIENKILLATIAVIAISDQHCEKMRWAMKEMGVPLGLIANFYPSRLDYKFIRNGQTTESAEVR